jgi:hypothetical protein
MRVADTASFRGDDRRLGMSLRQTSRSRPVGGPGRPRRLGNPVFGRASLAAGSLRGRFAHGLAPQHLARRVDERPCLVAVVGQDVGRARPARDQQRAVARLERGWARRRALQLEDHRHVAEDWDRVAYANAAEADGFDGSDGRGIGEGHPDVEGALRGKSEAAVHAESLGARPLGGGGERQARGQQRNRDRQPPHGPRV